MTTYIEQQIIKSRQILDKYKTIAKDKLKVLCFPVSSSLIFLGVSIYLKTHGLLFSNDFLNILCGFTGLSSVLGIALMAEHYIKSKKYMFNEEMFLFIKKLINDFNLDINNAKFSFTFKLDEEYEARSLARSLLTDNSPTIVDRLLFLFENDQFVGVVCTENCDLTKKNVASITKYLTEKISYKETKTTYSSELTCNESDEELRQLIAEKAKLHSIDINDINTLSRGDLINLHQLFIFDRVKLKQLLETNSLVTQNALTHDEIEVEGITSEDVRFNLAFLNEKYKKSMLDIQ